MIIRTVRPLYFVGIFKDIETRKYTKIEKVTMKEFRKSVEYFLNNFNIPVNLYKVNNDGSQTMLKIEYTSECYTKFRIKVIR